MQIIVFNRLCESQYLKLDLVHNFQLNFAVNLRPQFNKQIALLGQLLNPKSKSKEEADNEFVVLALL